MHQQHEESVSTSFESKYIKDKMLGEGQHAQVFKCFKKDDVNKAAPYAVKITRDDDEEKKLIFKKEFEIAHKLRHKNIVKAIELLCNDFTGETHTVMEYVEGKEVFELIAEHKDGCYTEDHSKELFKQVLEGIEYLHRNGVAHRDIKP